MSPCPSGYRAKRTQSRPRDGMEASVSVQKKPGGLLIGFADFRCPQGPSGGAVRMRLPLRGGDMSKARDPQGMRALLLLRS
ncbi:hypothetical protein GPN2_10522 [Streptomyces murinus]